MSGQIKDVTDQGFEETVIRADRPVLVDFWADWCVPCHLVAPIVEQLAMEHAGRMEVTKLNIDENPSTTDRFQVLSIPTLILFSGGVERGRVVGARSKEAIERALLGDLAA
ncbi:MAG: thioredoxin [Actinomycetota bacterium]|nr:thioredoxin [Actinomycetota bacterium]